MKISNRYILRLNRLVKFLQVVILLGTYQNEDRYGTQQDDSVLVKLSVSTTDADTASGDGTGTDAQVTSIYILQFNADDDSYGALRYVAEGKKSAGGTYTATLSQSANNNDNYRLVILANFPDYGFLYGLYDKSYAEIQRASLGTAADAPLVSDDIHPYPMFGVVNSGTSVQVQEGTAYSSNTESIRVVTRVDIGIGTKKTSVDDTVLQANTGVGGQPSIMIEVQAWKAGQKYTYIPVLANCHWTTTTTSGITSNRIVIDNPSTASGTTSTETYDASYITDGIYYAERICLPKADLQQDSVYGGQHSNRLAIIVGGYHNDSPDMPYYRVGFTNDNSGEKMNILRNHVYQFVIKSMTTTDYATAELVYKSMPKNLGFDAIIGPWTTGQIASAPSVSEYYLTYQEFNGEVTDWSYAADSSQKIPRKKSYWGTNIYLSFGYNDFCGEGSSFYSPNTLGGQSGILYTTVADTLNNEGTFPNLMVSGDDVVDESGSENVQWKTGTTLTASDLCHNLEENGHNDWRLPQLSELAFIYVNRGILEKIHGFTPLSGTYWCGSKYLGGTTNKLRKESGLAQAVDFNANPEHALYYKRAEKLKIRCVRQRSNDK